jgi:hypothetical protein
MIQTKEEIIYGNRLEHVGKIKIEIRDNGPVEGGRTFTVIDWDITNPSDSAIQSKIIFRSSAVLTQISDYIDANNNFTGLDYNQKMYKKLTIGLMMDTQTNLLDNGKTICQLTPNDWEFTPEITII